MTTETSLAVEAAAFRKKPVTIQAVQLTNEVAAAFLFDKKPLPDGVEFSSAGHKDGKINNFYSYINTLEGRMNVSLGDWIITGVKGEHYACKPDIFELTYERATLARPLEVAAPVGDAQIGEALRAWHGKMGYSDIEKMRAALLAASRSPAAGVAGGVGASREQDLSALMDKHGISVWIDPNWWPTTSVPRWLAGQNISAVEGRYYSTLTGSDPAQIEAENTCSGETPLLAVLAVIESITINPAPSQGRADVGAGE